MISLLGLAWSSALSLTVRDKDTVKNWLEESGIYGQITDTVINDAETVSVESLSVNTDQLPTEVKEAVNNAFNPAMLKDSTEKFVDGVYAWLEGSTDSPQVEVDISNAKNQLVEDLGSYATSRASSLPECTPLELQAVSRFDGINATCLPPGVTPEQVGQDTKEQLLNSASFLPDTKLSGEDIGGSNGQLLPEKLKSTYQTSKWLVPTFIVLVLISSVGVVFTSSTKRKGLGRGSAIYLISGIAVGFSAFIIGKGPERLNMLVSEATNSPGGARLAMDILTVAGREVGYMLAWFAAAYILLGLIGVLLTKFYKKSKDSDPLPYAVPKQPANDTTAARQTVRQEKKATPPQVRRSSSPKPPRKIQL